MKIDFSKQAYRPDYKEVKFRSAVAMEEWLKKLSKYKLTFKDDGQDLLDCLIAETGEILNCNLQGWIWNGRMVDLKNLKVGAWLPLIEVVDNQPRTVNMDFMVKRIDLCSDQE